jgi:hypothetical protein
LIRAYAPPHASGTTPYPIRSPASPCEPVRLREGPQHGDVVAPVEQADRAIDRRELAVRLVDDDERLLVGAVCDRLDGVERHHGAGRVVRRGEVHHALAVVGVEDRLGRLLESVGRRELVRLDGCVVIPRRHLVVRESRIGDEDPVARLERGTREVVDRAVRARRHPHLCRRDVPQLGDPLREIRV